ncbi:MAG: hypothetical protein AAGE52_18420 [Myxococcota bacterium]
MILLVTDNLRKYDELRRIFRRYNVKLERRSRAGFDPVDLPALFQERPKLKAVLDETSQLVREGENAHLASWRDPSHHLEPVTNRGRLQAWMRDGEVEVYTREIRGWLDHTRHEVSDEVFDWDAIFVVEATGLTYEQMRRRGLKNSVRDLVASDFLLAHLYFAERVDLKWSPQHFAQTVDFRRSVADFLAASPYLERDALARYGLDSLLDHVIAEGVFFRAAESRRQRNYWAPGLNGGIPLTPKRDPVHEITFMVHDLMHQMIPDLVFTGVPSNEDGARYRNVYCTWRMMSEAFTIVLADMLFVDTLAQRGVDYDFAKRRIWPLFSLLEFDATELRASLRRLLYANTRYALAGDDTELRALRRASVPQEEFNAALANYQAKYEGYFRADWEWTVTNFDAMRQRSDVFSRWADLADDELFAACHLRTLGDVVDALPANLDTLNATIDAVFELAIDHVLQRLDAPRLPGPDAQLVNAARRFMTGQLLLFAAWDFLPRSRELGGAISRTLKEPMTPKTVERLRAQFARHLDAMVAQQLISDDDRRTWVGAHPLFDPSYVAYERKRADGLAEVAARCFLPPQRSSQSPSGVATLQLGDAWFVDLQMLWSAIHGLEPAARLTALMRAAGVEFHDETARFVRRPAVALCGLGGFPISIEGSEVRVLNAALGDAAESARDMMGFASFMSYLNPRDRSATAMFEVVARHGHFSVAHVATVNVLLAGHSSAVEHELASQRDLVHLARLTVARTAAQDDPPLVVPDDTLLPVFQRVREAVAAERASHAPDGPDEREILNQLFPAAKGSLLLLSGSLRSLQKLVSQRDDAGKETEFRNLLTALHQTLSALWPALFEDAS